jgi:hypothetical protein
MIGASASKVEVELTTSASTVFCNVISTKMYSFSSTEATNGECYRDDVTPLLKCMVLCCCIAGGRHSPLLGDVGKHVLPYLCPIEADLTITIGSALDIHFTHRKYSTCRMHLYPLTRSDYQMVLTGDVFVCIGVVCLNPVRTLALRRVTF